MKVPTNVFYSDAQVNVGTIKLTNINNNKCQITFVWPSDLEKKSLCVSHGHVYRLLTLKRYYT